MFAWIEINDGYLTLAIHVGGLLFIYPLEVLDCQRRRGGGVGEMDYPPPTPPA